MTANNGSDTVRIKCLGRINNWIIIVICPILFVLFLFWFGLGFGLFVGGLLCFFLGGVCVSHLKVERNRLFQFFQYSSGT